MESKVSIKKSYSKFRYKRVFKFIIECRNNATVWTSVEYYSIKYSQSLALEMVSSQSHCFWGFFFQIVSYDTTSRN